MPQTGRAQSGPVMMTTLQKTTPTYAVVTAIASDLLLLLKRYQIEATKLTKNRMKQVQAEGTCSRNSLHVAHRLLRGSDHQTLIKAEGQQRNNHGNRNQDGGFSFGVEHRFKQCQTNSSKHQIIDREQDDPKLGRGLSGQDNLGAFHHGQQGGDGNRKQNQRQHHFSSARAQRNGREKRAVYD